MTTTPKHNVNYYFLNQFLHPKPYPGYKQSVVSFIVCKNNTPNKNNYLFVKEKTGFWFFPKGRIFKNNIADGFFEAITGTLERELGLKGMKVFDVKPNLVQQAYIFDFERQKYNQNRSEDEKVKGNPTKGKIYHLAIMEYTGVNGFPAENDKKAILEYKWINDKEAEELINKNGELVNENTGYTEGYNKFQLRFFKKILSSYETIQKLRVQKEPLQKTLFF